MTSSTTLLIWIVLIVNGDGQATRVVFICEIPVIVAGTPTAKTETPAAIVTDATTPTSESLQDENVTEIENDAAEGTNLNQSTQTVSIFPHRVFFFQIGAPSRIETLPIFRLVNIQSSWNNAQILCFELTKCSKSVFC